MQKSLRLCAVLAISISTMFGANITNGLSLGAEAEMFNKFGLNTHQSSPTETYGYFIGQVNAGYAHSFANHNLAINLGGAGAALAYDSTRSGDSSAGLGFNYIGFFAGYDGRGRATPNNTHNYFIHNAHLAYEGSYGENVALSFKGGRFLENDDGYIQGYIEGISAKADFGKAYVSLIGLSSTALLGEGFFWDYNRVYTPSGLANFSAGYKSKMLDVSVLYYYGISEYSAPGFDIALKFGNADSGIFAKTRLNVVFPIYDQIQTRVPLLVGALKPDFNDSFTSSILVRQDIIYTKESSSYSGSVALYKNVGFANARLGLFGSPLGVNIWDNSVYALGPSLNGIVSPDSLSVLFFTNASYSLGLKYLTNIDFGLDGRYTNAPSVDEYSLKFNLNFQLGERLALGFIANYYPTIVKNPLWAATPNDTTNGGYVGNNAKVDRSYIMTKIGFAI